MANEYVEIDGVRYAAIALTGATDSSGNPAGNLVTANAGNFTPSSIGSTTFTMDGTGQSEAIATGVTKLQVVNTGATTEAIYIGFGASAAEAITNLAITTDGAPEHATNGHYMPSPVDAPAVSPVLNVPAAAIGGYYAVCNAVDSDVQVVIVSQGV